MEELSDDGEELVDKQFEKMKAVHLKEGYREGIDAGKEFVLQQSFEWGYKFAFKTACKIGQFTGIVRTLKHRLGEHGSCEETMELDDREKYLQRLIEVEHSLAALQLTLRQKITNVVKSIPEQNIENQMHQSTISEHQTKTEKELDIIINELDEQLQTIQTTCQEIAAKLNLEI